MENLEVVILKTQSENLAKLNDKIYAEVEREGYHNHTTVTAEGLKTSIFVFNKLKDKDQLQGIINGYTYENKLSVYFGTVSNVEEYIAKEYSGKPKRIRIHLENGESYDLPKMAKLHLKL